MRLRHLEILGSVNQQPMTKRKTDSAYLIDLHTYYPVTLTIHPQLSCYSDHSNQSTPCFVSASKVFREKNRRKKEALKKIERFEERQVEVMRCAEENEKELILEKASFSTAVTTPD